MTDLLPPDNPAIIVSVKPGTAHRDATTHRRRPTWRANKLKARAEKKHSAA
jgi:hypothetical protein